MTFYPLLFFFQYISQFQNNFIDCFHTVKYWQIIRTHKHNWRKMMNKQNMLKQWLFIHNCIFMYTALFLVFFSPTSLFLPGRLEFTVGSKAVNKFRLIERHYFSDLLVKTFDFEITHLLVTLCHHRCSTDKQHLFSFLCISVEEMITHPF